MKSQFDNSVIIIGADHHNTLAVVRCFGKMKCNQKILIHTKHQTLNEIHIAHSKYAIGKVSCVSEEENDIIQWLLAHKTDKKQILFPCSDLAAYTIDKNYEILYENYLMPGFQGCPGEVARLMNKWEQNIFAIEHGLSMAKTWSLKNNNGFFIPQDMVYPCIVKPEISAFGNKGDIAICNSEEELREVLNKLNNAGYLTLIVQQFLHKEYEVCAYGCLVKNKDFCAGGTIRKMREFPPKGGGSLTYARFIDVNDVNIQRNKVLDILYNLGYTGQYDIEFLVCKEGVYLNEINFRHSGNGYALIQNGVHAPYIWAADAVEVDISRKMKTFVKAGKHHMDELSDLMHLKDNNLSFVTWLCDCLRTSAFSKWDIFDMGGAFTYYLPLFKRAINKIFSRGK